MIAMSRNISKKRNNFVFDDLALSCTESMIRVKVGLNWSHDLLTYYRFILRQALCIQMMYY